MDSIEQKIKALSANSSDFRAISGTNLFQRNLPFVEWSNTRKQLGVWPFSKTFTTRPDTMVKAYNDHDTPEREFLNFGSQDYLSLSTHPEVIEAARQAIYSYGVHSAGSAILTGRSSLADLLEQKLAHVLGTEQCLLFTSGWMACFGAIAGLASKEDFIIHDILSHNCLDVAAHYTTKNNLRFRHNDLEDLERKLQYVSINHPASAAFIVTESLFSMNSDSPDFHKLLHLKEKYGAILILDVAHDFGCMGEHGKGLLETIPADRMNDIVIVGSFSKTFAANGGFVAGPQCIRERITFFAPTYTFSNAIAPMQCAAAMKSLDIAFSMEGHILRNKLMSNVDYMRERLKNEGFIVNGNPSPIVPVLIYDARIARILSRELTKLGVISNLIEYPAVPKGQALFRFQMMAAYTEKQIDSAITNFKKAENLATEMLNSTI